MLLSLEKLVGVDVELKLSNQHLWTRDILSCALFRVLQSYPPFPISINNGALDIFPTKIPKFQVSAG